MLEYIIKSKGKKKDKSPMTEDSTENDLEEMCGKIDDWALWVFIALYVMMVGTYFYCVYIYA